MRILEENDPATTATADQAGAAAGAGTDTAAAVADSKTATDAGAGKGQGEAAAPAQAGKEGEQGKDAGDGKGGDGKDTDEDKGEQPVVPEKYDVPEGVTVTDARLQFYSELAKGAGFTQEQFSQSIAQAESMRAQEREFERGEWRLQSEEQFGKDFDGIAKGAERAIVELEKDRPGITDRLDATNLGNHPDVLWAFNKIGELLKPKKMEGIDTESSAAGKLSPGERAYQYADKPQGRPKP